MGGEGITQGTPVQNTLPSPLDYDKDGYFDYIEEHGKYKTDPTDPASYPDVPLDEAIRVAHADYVSNVNAGTMKHWYDVPYANQHYSIAGSRGARSSRTGRVRYGATRIPYKAIGIGVGVVAVGAAVGVGGSGSGGGSSSASGGAVTVYIDSRARDQGTGVFLNMGQSFSVRASGSIDPGVGQGWGMCGPDGGSKPAGGGFTFPAGGACQLIGRVGNSGYFSVRSNFSGTAPATGELKLLMNDSIYDDNAGGYTATITY